MQVDVFFFQWSKCGPSFFFFFYWATSRSLFFIDCFHIVAGASRHFPSKLRHSAEFGVAPADESLPVQLTSAIVITIGVAASLALTIAEGHRTPTSAADDDAVERRRKQQRRRRTPTSAAAAHRGYADGGTR